MTTTTFTAGTSDGYVTSSGTGAALYSGSGLTVDTTSTDTGHVGQVFGHQAHETFLQFDTSSIPDTDDITAVTLTQTIFSDNSAVDFVIEVYVYDWGTTCETADWRTPTHVGSLTRVATKSTSGGLSGAVAFVSDAAFLTAINKTGATRLVMVSDKFRTSTEPTGAGDEFVRFYTANDGTDSRRPKLEVVHDASYLPPPRPQQAVYRM